MTERVQLELIDLGESVDQMVDGVAEHTESGAEQTRPGHLPVAPENGLVRSLERPRLQAYLALLASDVIVLLTSFYIVSAAYLGTFTNFARLESGMLPAYLILPLYLTIALYNGTYSRRTLTNWHAGIFRALTALIISAALLNLLAFFAKSNAEFSRLVFVAGSVVTVSFIAAGRIAVARWIRRRWGPGAVNTMVIHSGGPVFTLPHAYHVNAEEHGLVPDIQNPHALDRLSKYLRNMDEVIVSCRDGQRKIWSEVLKGTGIHGEVVDPLLREIGAIGVAHHDDAGISALSVSAGQLGIRARVTKRLFDIAVSGLALLALSPLMLLAALLVKLEDRGPVFFVQRRMGRGNRFFNILKFRSMRAGDAEGDRSAERDDERVTRIGRFLRKTSIDELPQLINVLRGDMSLVGPRPHALGSKAGSKLFWEVDRKYWERHGLRPGMTGLAQIRGYRGATDTEQDLSNRLIADLEYIQSWSLWRDITILGATLRVLVHERAF